MFEKVRTIIADVCQMPEEEITEQTNLTADLGLNSFELVNLIIAFEDAFHIEVADDELDRFETVADIMTYLEEIVG